MFFIESSKLDDFTMNQKEVVSSLKLRLELKDKGYTFLGCFDPQAIEVSTPDWIKPYWEVAKQKLPCLLIVDDQGNKKALDLPSNIEEMRKLFP